MSVALNEANEAELMQLTDLFRLLSDKTRLNILFLLASGERNVTHLCKSLNLPQPTVSHHLGLLRYSKMIGNRRAGKQVFYGLDDRVNAGGSSLVIDIEHFHVRIQRNNNTATTEISVPSVG